MNNQYKYVGQTLTPNIAEELIRELFAGQTAQRQEIIGIVDKIHRERSGKLSESKRHHPVTSALSAMKRSGLAKNPKRGSWFILPQIKTLSDFVEWAEQFDRGENSERYLFRGVSSKEYEMNASAYRRPKEEDRNFETFLQINRELVREARLLGHGWKNGRELEDLEVLAELQHYAAATCLIDFTYNALVALWFACQPNSKNSPKDGKVIAVRNQSFKFKEVTVELLEQRIDDFFQSNEDESSQVLQPQVKQLYQWQPRQQNNRILAQQSIFLFGDVKIDADEECIIISDSKEKILKSLKQIYGITEAMLFPDFEGFARRHNQGILYQSTASQYRENGVRAYQRGEYMEAIAYFNDAIRLNRDDVYAYHNRGNAKLELYQYESAIADYDEVICLNPDDAEAYFNRGVANLELRRYESALADYDEVIRLNPDYAGIYNNRGIAKLELGQYESAILDYDKSIELNPNNAEAYCNRGNAMSKLGEYESAMADYDYAIRLDPDNARIYVVRGDVKSELGQHESAVADYNEAIRLYPDNARAYFKRGAEKYELGHFDEAEQDCRMALSIASQTGDQKLLTGLEELLPEFDQFRRETIGGYDDAIRLNPNDAGVYQSSGRAKARFGQHKEAIADYDEAIRLSPDGISAYNRRGIEKAKLGQHKEAIADYNETIRQGLGDSTTYQLRGLAKSKLGQYKEAIADFDSAIQLDPDSAASAYFCHGLVQKELNYIGEAIVYFQTALQLAARAGDTNLVALVKSELDEFKPHNVGDDSKDE